MKTEILSRDEMFELLELNSEEQNLLEEIEDISSEDVNGFCGC